MVKGSRENPVYQVGGKSFVFFRTPRPDAFDPETGERYDDVIDVSQKAPPESSHPTICISA